jgi:hypothetical protein
MRKRIAMRSTMIGVLVVLLALPGLGCAAKAARASQFERFALAGTQFADAVQLVLDESFETKVATSSLVLVEARPNLDRDQRLEAIEDDDTELRERLSILDDLKKHARILRGYFVALQTLAQTDAESSGLVDVTNGLVGALGGISPAIARATVGGQGIQDLIRPAVDFAFGSFQSRALERELRRNAPTVERELALQQAALTVIADAMRSDLEAQAEAEDRDRIHLPYVQEGTLPADWNERRLNSFRRRIRLSSVDAATQAVETIRSSFVALVENRLDDAAIGALIRDVTEIVTFVEGVTRNPQREDSR